MATIHTAAIQELYVAYFNRPADANGLAFWEGVVAASNGDTAAVSAAFAASAEYQAEYDQLTTAGVVTQIYQNLFNRAPDAAGLAYWVKAIQDKIVTIDQAVAVIANGSQGSDTVAFDSKVLVATAFTAALDTDAEKAGYSGDLANAAAKVLLAGITTAAQATAAVVPATLNASVAAVIKAGVPFSLTTALTDLAAAEDAVDAFLAAADGDDDEDTSTDRVALELDVTNAAVAFNAEMPGFSAATPGVRAAMLADEIAERDAALVTAQSAVAAANVEIAKVAGLATAVTSLAAATGLHTAAQATTITATSTLAGAVAAYNSPTTGVDVTVAANGTVTDTALVPMIVLNASGQLVFAASLSTELKTALTPVLNATIALEAAEKAEAAALASQTAAQTTVDRTDYDAAAAGAQLVAVGTAMEIVQIAAGAKPTAAQINTEIAALAAIRAAAETSFETARAGAVTFAVDGSATFTPTAGVAAGLLVVTATVVEFATGVDEVSHPGVTALRDAARDVEEFKAAVATFDAADNTNPLVEGLDAATTLVDTANDEIDELAGWTETLEEAQALVTELDALEEVVGAAEEVFTENDFAQPIAVAGVVGATGDSDIYMAGTVNSTIVNFGLVGDDKLFIGTEFTLNTSTKVNVGGNNAVLEVFLIQSGADTIVTLEKVVFGSNSAAEAETTITLTGVNVADVSLANGIITVA